ncbi:ATP-binding protein [Trichlorobacter lovleyi]|uniref:ATP-binding protein n=1 Tax=Trichlorobacter lovleyi TaxID=313985 RepID=UPI0023F07319|nr:ATP-binding protein [Trichlorobacter lovleyi]
MSLALEIKSPPAATRERFWKNILLKNQVHFADDELKLVVDLNISPAVINTSARFASKIGGTADDIRFAALGIIKAMNGGRQLSLPTQEQKFNLELTSADIDLNSLTDRLCRSQSRAFSLCLYGPSGTGKSAYLRHLAEQLGISIVFKRASDMLDKHLGESEKSIAAAFQEANDLGALLIFDEADSLLGDRRQATYSWEISQVNEMLTWTECHPLPFACTTNLRERIDPASLRRFTFKCKFDYLEAKQAARAYSHFFGHELRMAAKRQLSLLTPSDFVVVKRKAEILGLLNDTEALTELLLEEVDKRGCGIGRKIGFSLCAAS